MARKRTIDIPEPELTGEPWEKLAPLLPEPEPSPGGPKPIPNRPVVEGILWVLRNGGRRKSLPKGYPSSSNGWRRLAEWEERGAWLDKTPTLTFVVIQEVEVDDRAWAACR